MSAVMTCDDSGRIQDLVRLLDLSSLATPDMLDQENQLKPGSEYRDLSLAMATQTQTSLRNSGTYDLVFEQI